MRLFRARRPAACRRTPVGTTRRARLALEQLEHRTLLSASHLIHTLSFPSDPKFTQGQQWDMEGGFGSNASAAWKLGYTGLNVKATVVGVVDEGIQFSHADLAGRVSNPGEVAGNRKDDDHNGFVDDVYGWDFVNNDNSVYDGGPRGNQDDHGTHVAGIIAADGNNGIGLAGIDWNADLSSAKFLGRGGYGTDKGAIAAINYLVNLKVNQHVNIVAINASWGSSVNNRDLYNAIKSAGDNNILVVAAAGNSGTNNDVTPFYPADFDLPNVITVTAIDKNGNLPAWANYGATTVDIGAPGVGIVSTVPNDKYASYSGTSMAAPHVTGAIALYAAYHPEATAAQIKDALLASAVPTASLAGKTVTGGRLDILNFLTTAPGTVAVKAAASTSSGSTTKGGARTRAGGGATSLNATIFTLDLGPRATGSFVAQQPTFVTPPPAAAFIVPQLGPAILQRVDVPLGEGERGPAETDTGIRPVQGELPQAVPVPPAAPRNPLEILGRPMAQSLDVPAVQPDMQFVEPGEAVALELPETAMAAEENEAALLGLALGFLGGWGLAPPGRREQRRRTWLERE